jgi:hypothetical protein
MFTDKITIKGGKQNLGIEDKFMRGRSLSTSICPFIFILIAVRMIAPRDLPLYYPNPAIYTLGKKKERKEKKKKRRKGTHAHVVHIMIERKEEWTRRISHILTITKKNFVK